MADVVNSVCFKTGPKETPLVMTLYRVVSMRHRDAEHADEQARYIVELLETDIHKHDADQGVIRLVVPVEIERTVIDAFLSHGYVLASHFGKVLDSAIPVNIPKRFDATGYIADHCPSDSEL